MKIRKKMLVFIGVPTLLIVVILALISYVYSSKLLTDEIKGVMQITAKKYGSDIETILSGKKAYIEISAGSIEANNNDRVKTLEQLKYLSKNVKGTLGFFVGYEDKSFLDGTGWVPDSTYDPRVKDWYKSSMSTDDIIISEPYINASEGSQVVTLSKRIRQNGKTIGSIGSDIALKEIEELVNSIKLEETGRAYLMNIDGKVIVHPSYTLKDNINTVENGVFAEAASKLLTGKEEFLDTKVNGENKYYVSYPVAGTTWVLLLEVPKKEVLAVLSSLSIFMAIVGIIAIAVIVFIIMMISKSIATPINKLSECIQTMANYDMTLSEKSPAVIYSNNKDEIGDISRSLITVKETMKDTLTKINDIASQVSASSEELTATSEQSAMAAEDLSKVIQDISQGAMSQAEDMQKGTMAMDVMGEALKENDKEIQELNQTSEQVFNAKEKGLKSIQDLITATDKVKSSSKVVGEVIQNTNQSAIQISSASDMIKSIADQTNLLALNAAIEAARAGEAGKGFAVVAEEIRKLAEQSNQFTEEIKEIVTGLTTKTKQTVEMMEEVGQVVEEQSEKVEDTRSQFNVISNQLDNTKKSVDRLNKSGKELESTKDKLQEIIENLSALSQENAASAEESSATVEKQTASSQEIASASANLADMAQEMSEMISKFKI